MIEQLQDLELEVSEIPFGLDREIPERIWVLQEIGGTRLLHIVHPLDGRLVVYDHSEGALMRVLRTAGTPNNRAKATLVRPTCRDFEEVRQYAKTCKREGAWITGLARVSVPGYDPIEVFYVR